MNPVIQSALRRTAPEIGPWSFLPRSSSLLIEAFSRHPALICAVFVRVALRPLGMTVHTAFQQSPLSVVVHFFKPGLRPSGWPS
jgi:hypothetical protein